HTGALAEPARVRLGTDGDPQGSCSHLPVTADRPDALGPGITGRVHGRTKNVHRRTVQADAAERGLLVCTFEPVVTDVELAERGLLVAVIQSTGGVVVGAHASRRQRLARVIRVQYERPVGQ